MKRMNRASWLILAGTTVLGCEGLLGEADGGPDATVTDAGGIGALLTDAGTAGLSDGGTCPSDARPCLTVASATPPTAIACDAARMVGRVMGTSCIDIDAWHATPLFQDGSGGPAALNGAVPKPPEMNNIFCLYQWTGGGEPNANAFDQGFVLLPEPDCAVVAAQASPPEAYRATLAAGFEAQIEQFPGAALPDIPGHPRPGGVRVAVLDTVPDQAAGPGDIGDASNAAEHGRSVGRIIQRAACPECPTLAGGTTQWPVKIANHTALDVAQDGRSWDAATGGYFGYQGRVAQTIWEAFQSNYTDPADLNLIINLSLGWDRRYSRSDRDPARLRPAVVAARMAIAHAACQGALIIAAAGNDAGGPTGGAAPMLPAAWQTDARACAPGGPLVTHIYAVGGLTPSDTPLPSARALSRPRLAAPGLFATVAQRGGGYTTPLSGTSAATAVVSAAAAVIWRYLPGLTAAQIMRRVYTSGVNLGEPAEYYGGMAAPDVHRVSVCRAAVAAFNEACMDLGAGCATTVAAAGCAPVAARAGVAPAPDEAGGDDDPEALVDVDAAITLDDTVRWPGCAHTDLRVDLAHLPSNPCPADQYYSGNVAPWGVSPQPTIRGCDFCATARQDGIVYVQPADGVTMTDPILRTDIGLDYALDPFATGFTGGELYKFELSGLETIKSAKLTYTVIDKSGKTEEVFSGSDAIWVYD
jgi:hypothetical protein